jgi:hypothetical protein
MAKIVSVVVGLSDTTRCGGVENEITRPKSSRGAVVSVEDDAVREVSDAQAHRTRTASAYRHRRSAP